MEEPSARPRPDGDAWAEARGWDERSLDLDEATTLQGATEAGKTPEDAGWELTAASWEERARTTSHLPRARVPRWHTATGLGVTAAVLALVVKVLFVSWMATIDLGATRADVWTYMIVYGLVGLFAGFASRWTTWDFGLSHVLYAALYEAIGFWLIRLGTAVSFVGSMGFIVDRYLF